MAAVTRPGPADARVPCPLCGGLIHPIAGRCKHCKGDLRAMRTTRPAAAATLPALGAAGATSPAPTTAPASTNGHSAPTPHGAPQQGAAPADGYAPAPPPQSLVQAVAAAAPIPLAIQGAAGSIPILPPRPTGRFAAPAPRASWRSWPVIVIVLAVIAIVTAVVLMLFPPGGARDEGTRNSVQPAPDRMDTNPSPSTPHQPPSTGPDPWSRRGSAGSALGSAGSAAPPTADDDRDIDDPSVDDALANRDPLSRRGGGRSLQPGIGALNTDMLFSIFRHGCARVSACGSASAEVEMFCTNLGKVAPTQPPTCAAAPRCLRTIDQMSCDTFTDVQSIYALKDKLSDCVDAMGC